MGSLYSFSLLSFSDMMDVIGSVGLESFSGMVDVVVSVRLESFSFLSFSDMTDFVGSLGLESFSEMVDFVGSVGMESFPFPSFSDMMDVDGSVRLGSFTFLSFSGMVDVVSMKSDFPSLLSFVEVVDVGSGRLEIFSSGLGHRSISLALLSGDELRIAHLFVLSCLFLSGVGQPGLRKVWDWALFSSGRLVSVFFLHCRAVRYC